MKNKHFAFSLVELSIVLVILGLLVGGILAGKSLIRASELRAVTTEYNRYTTAASTFRDKYFYLPGDLINAASIWGPADTAGNSDGKGVDCRVESSTTATCSGDGDGLISTNSANSVNENTVFWKHLANAGLIEGQYSGYKADDTANTMCVSTDRYMASCNSPASKYGRGAWTISDYGSLTGNSFLFDGFYGNTFALSASPTTTVYTGYLVRTEDGWNIDSKMDDGLPATGKLVVSRWNQCATGTSSADLTNARYNVASTLYLCTLFFRKSF